MTQLEKRLADFLLGELGELPTEKAVAHLFACGLIDRHACEARAIRAESERMVRQGTPLCEAMRLLAERFCCSYGKVRGIVYRRDR